MEDFILVRRLRHKGKIVIVPKAVVTSPRRWLHLGILKTWLINQLIIMAYYLGLPSERLTRIYRREAGKSGRTLLKNVDQGSGQGVKPIQKSLFRAYTLVCEHFESV